MTGECPYCHRRRRARKPRGGDGTAVIVLRHTRQVVQAGEWRDEQCLGSFSTVDATDE